MNWRSFFIGAATVPAVLTAPAFYYATQESETFVARVEGRTQAHDPKFYRGPRHLVFTDRGTLDDFGRPGLSLREGCSYQFNVKGARVHVWPPSYSRTIKSARPVHCPK